MLMSDNVAELAAALALAQGEVENAHKNSANPHFRSKYADLAEIINTVRPVFAKHGLAIVQSPSYADGLVSVTTLLTHKSGQWIRDVASSPAPKLDPQGVGSAVTYLRRYAIGAFACIASEADDDGNAASQRKVASPSASDLEKASNMLRACQSLADLKTAYGSLSPELRQAMASVKDDMKDKLS